MITVATPATEDLLETRALKFSLKTCTKLVIYQMQFCDWAATSKNSQ
jgi:hypothetical protein